LYKKLIEDLEPGSPGGDLVNGGCGQHKYA
jgi:hypothetical protein